MKDARLKYDLVTYEDDGSWNGFKCANGFVSRCVSAVAGENLPDARRVAEILNAHFEAQDKETS